MSHRKSIERNPRIRPRCDFLLLSSMVFFLGSWGLVLSHGGRARRNSTESVVGA
jgi:hypothetical protein